MHILVLGTGAVGGYFGARLAAVGKRVTFVARGAHKAAIERDGLRVISPNGSLRLFYVKVVDQPARVGPVDLVLVAVKLWSLEAALESCRPILKPETGVIPVQNGVEAPDIIARILGPEHACGGVAYIGGRIERPGVIRHTGTLARLVFGERDGSRSERLAVLEQAAQEAEFNATLSPEIDVELWRKFVFLAPMAGSTAFRRDPIGAVLADAEGRALFEALVAETAAVGRARAVALPGGLEEQTLAFARGLPFEMRSSMLGDLEAGNRLELDWLTGAVVRLGAEAGVPTPRSGEVYAALAPLKDGAGPAGG